MPKLIPKEKIAKIKELRKKGFSLSEIKKEVQVGHGSVFRYIQGIEILPKYRQVWHSKRGGSFKKMILAQKKAKEKAEKQIKRLSDKERIIFLSALYWGEGTKSELRLSNTDPNLIRIFVRGLLNFFGINRNKLRANIRIYSDLDKEKCLRFWSKVSGLSIEQFTNVTILEGKKKGKLPYGMCQVRVIKGGDVLKYLIAFKNRVIDLF